MPIFNKAKTVCFSGHRVMTESETRQAQGLVFKAAAEQISNGYDCFICGGALGFDTVAAGVVIEMKKIHPLVKLVIAVPYKGQESKWSEADKEKYAFILANADISVLLSDNYHNGCLQARNRYMVDNSSLLIAYCKRASGGTAYTYTYAINSGIERINLYGLNE